MVLVGRTELDGIYQGAGHFLALLSLSVLCSGGGWVRGVRGSPVPPAQPLWGAGSPRGS